MGVEIDLTGRAVLVTGGTRGIGAGIAEVLLRAGAQVVVCSRTEPARRPPGRDGARAEFVRADVRDPGQVDELIAEAVRRCGRLDAVVNNAGGAPPADTATASPRFHAKIVELNLLAPLLVSQRAWPVLPAGGSITMISSVAAHRAAPTIAAYAAAKAGVESLTRTLALEFAPRVRVNAVSVGVASTENFREHFGHDARDSGFAAGVPLGRPAEPEEVGQACAFLASPLAGYLTGAVLPVHGGGEHPEHLVQLARDFAQG